MKLETILQILFPLATIIGAIVIAAVNARNTNKTNKANLRITKENHEANLRITKEDHEANLRLTQKAHEEEKKRVKREKLEQLLRATYALKEEFENRQSIFLFSNEKTESGETDDSSMIEIQTLTALYFNELEASVDFLTLHYTEYCKIIIEFTKLRFPGPKDITEKQATSVTDHHIKLGFLSGVLRRECQNIMTKLDKW